ncbi:VWA domain-containing protein [Vibrio makurazakiensis]|uniref:VWA domain-containing protein n=1 Tax=Vibrio makurazakiensis TaxID=2910250 RepID=UPI003D0DE164
MIEFEYVWVLFLLPIPVLIYCLSPSYYTKQIAVKVPFFQALIDSLNLNVSNGATTLKAKPWQRLSLTSGWLLLILAAAKPMWLGPEETRDLSGRDMLIIVDLSGSMATEDFTDSDRVDISRIDASKAVLTDFSQQRKGDRLGLIVFGEAAYLQSPFTADHSAWLTLLNESQPGMAGPSTHLGDAIGLGIKTFINEKQTLAPKDKAQRSHPDKQKVMVVLTDGNDTDSLVPPIDAARVAAAYGIKIHVVAMGSPNTAGEQAIEMEVIDKIANITGGESFLAMSPSQLSDIYEVINQIEPIVFESYTFRNKESFHYLPILIALFHQLIFMAFSSYWNWKKQVVIQRGD